MQKTSNMWRLYPITFHDADEKGDVAYSVTGPLGEVREYNMNQSLVKALIEYLQKQVKG